MNECSACKTTDAELHVIDGHTVCVDWRECIDRFMRALTQ